jgi:uncharacterized protein YceH (UPF0502 family)
MIERREGALAQRLAPMPGMKEPRYAQTLGGTVESSAALAGEHTSGSSPVASSERLAVLEAEVARLRGELEDLRRRFDELLS